MRTAAHSAAYYGSTSRDGDLDRAPCWRLWACAVALRVILIGNARAQGPARAYFPLIIGAGAAVKLVGSRRADFGEARAGQRHRGWSRFVSLAPTLACWPSPHLRRIGRRPYRVRASSVRFATSAEWSGVAIVVPVSTGGTRCRWIEYAVALCGTDERYASN